MPFIIEEEDKEAYLKGLQEYEKDKLDFLEKLRDKQRKCESNLSEILNYEL